MIICHMTAGTLSRFLVCCVCIDCYVNVQLESLVTASKITELPLPIPLCVLYIGWKQPNQSSKVV